MNIIIIIIRVLPCVENVFLERVSENYHIQHLEPRWFLFLPYLKLFLLLMALNTKGHFI